MKYRIINISQLTLWGEQNYDLQLSLENLMSIHREHDFRISDFIAETLNTKYPYACRIIIARDDRKITAIARCQQIADDQYEISAVHVHKDYRGRNLCQKILGLLIDSYPTSKITFVLEVAIDNIAAIKCYEKMGFKIKNQFLFDTNKYYFMST